MPYIATGPQHALLAVVNTCRIFLRRVGGYLLIAVAGYFVISLASNQSSRIPSMSHDDKYSYDSYKVLPAYDKSHTVDNVPAQLDRWYLTNSSLHDSPKFRRNTVCHVWPAMLPNSDRIENQLLFKPNRTISPKKLILMTGAPTPTNKRLPIGQSFFLKNKCPVSQCRITYEKDKASEADVLVFKDKVPDMFLQVFKRPQNQIWVLSLLEAPHHTESFGALRNQINWTATYRQDSDLVTPYGKYVLYDPAVSQRKQETNFAATKSGTGKVAWFVSNCETANGRMQYAKELSKYIKVDIFGSCGPNQCSRLRQGKCESVLKRDYKFYLGFENSNCRWYITEKLWMPLRSDVVPVVMGAPAADYEYVAPFRSFIHVNDFSGPKALADYLHYVDKNDTAYNGYFTWKGTGELINTFFMCRLCALLHAEGPKKTYTDVQRWWNNDQCTHGPLNKDIVMEI